MQIARIFFGVVFSFVFGAIFGVTILPALYDFEDLKSFQESGPTVRNLATQHTSSHLQIRQVAHPNIRDRILPASQAYRASHAHHTTPQHAPHFSLPSETSRPLQNINSHPVIPSPPPTTSYRTLREAAFRKEPVPQVDEHKEGSAGPSISSSPHLDILRAVLSPETVATRTVILTFANTGYQDFLENWVSHVRLLGWRNVLVGALDQHVHTRCREEWGVPSFFMNTTEHLAQALGLQMHKDVAAASVTSGDFRSSSHRFHKMGGEKSALVLGLLELGLEVLLSDSDTVWIRDPWTYLRGASQNADILVSTDCPSIYADRVQSSFERSRCTHFEGSREQIKFNTGVVYFHNTPTTREFVQQWMKRLLTSGHLVYDQEAFNQLAESGSRPIKMVNPGGRHFWAWNRKMKLGTLPASHFCNGHVFLVQRRPQQLGLHPYVVHPTFQLEGAVGKKSRFRQAGLWRVDPDEYYTRGNFLVYSGSVPASLTEGVMPSIDSHMNITAYHQLAARNAFALAKILGRIVILPRLLCHCDMYWGSPTVPSCVTWGSDLSLPFECPADHIFPLPQWEWARREWREADFLDNPRVPRAVSSSRAQVRIVHSHISSGCGPGCTLDYNIGDPRPAEPDGELDPESCTAVPTLAASAQPLKMPTAMLPAHSSEKMVREVLKHYKDVRVLEFVDSTAEAFCGFDSSTDNKMFDDEMDGALNGIWCCAPEESDPRSKAYKHLKEPDQKPNDGTLRHKKPPRLSRDKDPLDSTMRFCQGS